MFASSKTFFKSYLYQFVKFFRGGGAKRKQDNEGERSLEICPTKRNTKDFSGKRHAIQWNGKRKGMLSQVFISIFSLAKLFESSLLFLLTL